MKLDKKNKILVKEIIEWSCCIIIAIIIALLFRFYIATPTEVRMRSMFPTLKEGDRLILNRTIRISHKNPSHGDIITFEAPSKKKYMESEIDLNNPIAKYENEPQNILERFKHYVLEWGKESYIKRVIATQGEHVQIKNGKVYINDNVIDEEYLQHDIITEIDGAGFSDFIVPKNCVFAMGDNRTESTDCRNFGCIPIEKIEGVVYVRIWPFNKIGTNI